MKLNKLFLLILSLALFACGQKEEVTYRYSCDPEANMWAQTNLESIQKMTRADVVSLSDSKIRAAFRIFDAGQRKAFWLDKLSEVLLLDWSKDEQAHIEKVIDFIESNPQIFDGKLEENETLYDLFDRFMYEWISYAETELGWDRQVIGAMLATGKVMTDKTGRMQSISPRVKTAAEKECYCNLSFDFCFSAGDCVDTECVGVPEGCGLLSLMTCDGECK